MSEHFARPGVSPDMESTLTVAVPPHPSNVQRAELIEQLVADLRAQLTAADWFECKASRPVVRRGWEQTECGRVWPQYTVSNRTTYLITIVQGPEVVEVVGVP